MSKMIKPSFRIREDLWIEFCAAHPNMASQVIRRMIIARMRKLKESGETTPTPSGGQIIIDDSDIV